MAFNSKLYPPDWRRRRLRILERDGHRCKFCKVKNYAQIIRLKEGVYIYTDNERMYNSTGEYQGRASAKYLYGKPIKIILTVMHLDHDEWNWEVTDDRLAVSCQRCHLNYDRIDNQLRKKYGKQYRRYQFTIPL